MSTKPETFWQRECGMGNKCSSWDLAAYFAFLPTNTSFGLESRQYDYVLNLYPRLSSNVNIGLKQLFKFPEVLIEVQG